MKKVFLSLTILFLFIFTYSSVNANVVKSNNWNVVINDGFEESSNFDDYNSYYSERSSVVSDNAITENNSVKIQTDYTAGSWTDTMFSTEGAKLNLIGGNSYRFSVKMDVESFQAIMIEVRTGWGTNTKADMPYEFGLFVDETNNTISRRPGWIPFAELNTIKEDYSIDSEGIISLSFEFVSDIDTNAVILIKGQTGALDNASMLIDDFKIEKGPRMTEDFSKTTGDFWNSSVFWANSGAITSNESEAIDGVSLRYDFLDNSAEYNVPLGGISESKFTTALGKRHYVEFDVASINSEKLDFILNGDGMYKEAKIDFVNGAISGNFDNLAITDLTTHYHVSFDFVAGSNATNTFVMFGGAPLNENGSIVLDNFNFSVEDVVTVTPVLDNVYDKSENTSLIFNMDIAAEDFIGISNGGNALVDGSDFTFIDGRLVVNHSYLVTLARGNNTLTAEYNGGTIDIVISIIDNSPVVDGDSYDDFSKLLGLNHEITVDLLSQTFTEITYDGVVVDGVNYSLVGDTLTMNGSYLSNLEVGTHTFTITSTGGDTLFDIVIIEGLKPILNEDRDYTKGDLTDIEYIINVDYSKVTGIKLDDVLIDSVNYILESGKVTLLNSYLESLPMGLNNFKLISDENDYSFSVMVYVGEPIATGDDLVVYDNQDITFNVDLKGISIQSIDVYGEELDQVNYEYTNLSITILDSYLSLNTDKNLTFVVTTEGGSITLKIKMVDGDEYLPNPRLVVNEGFESISNIEESNIFYTEKSTIITSDNTEIIRGDNSLKIASTYPANSYTDVLLTTESDVLEIYGSNSYKLSMSLRADEYQAIMFEVRTGWDTNVKPDLQYDFGLAIDNSGILPVVSRRIGFLPTETLNVSNENFYVDEFGVIHISFVFQTTDKAVIELKGQTGNVENASLIIDDFKIEEVPYHMETFENASSDFWNTTYFWANNGGIIADNDVISGDKSLKFTFTDNSELGNIGLGGITNTDFSTYSNKLHMVEFDIRLKGADIFVLALPNGVEYFEFILNSDGSYSGNFDNTTVTFKGDYYHVSLDFTAGENNHTFEFFGGAELNTISDIIIDNFVVSLIDDSIHVISVDSAVFNKSSESNIEYIVDFNADELTSISYSGSDLLKDTDYSIIDGLIIFNSSYLTTLDEGVYTFSVNQGSLVKDVSITVLDTRPELGENTYGDYNLSLSQNLEIVLNLKGFDLVSLSDGNNDLIKDTDFTITGDELVLLNSYLNTLSEGMTTFEVTTSEGSVSFDVDVVLGNTPVETNNSEFDFGNQEDVVITINVPVNIITGIKINSTDVDPSNYSIVDGSITLNKNYLASLSKGEHSFELVTNDATFTFTVEVLYNAPTVTGESSFIYEDTFIEVSVDFKGIEDVEVKLGSEVIASQNYVLTTDSVKLKAEYLDTLEPGEHVITVKTLGGEVFVTITIEESAIMTYYFVVGAVVLVGVIGFIGKKFIFKA